jgi:hypothetical protein
MYPPSNSTTTSLSALRHIFSESELETVSEFHYIEKFLTLIPLVSVCERTESVIYEAPKLIQAQDRDGSGRGG